jgi:hypothetical protein
MSCIRGVSNKSVFIFEDADEPGNSDCVGTARLWNSPIHNISASDQVSSFHKGRRPSYQLLQRPVHYSSTDSLKVSQQCLILASYKLIPDSRRSFCHIRRHSGAYWRSELCRVGT